MAVEIAMADDGKIWVQTNWNMWIAEKIRAAEKKKK